MLKIPQDDSDARTKRWVAIMCLIIWLLGSLFVCTVKADDTNTRAINAYIDHFHRLVSKKKADRAKRFTDLIVSESRQAGLDPLLVAVLISLESGYRPSAEGHRGERGLLQLMPAHCPGCDLSTPVGQIRAGCKRLAYAFAQCKSLSGALTHYACGQCRSKSDRTRKKMQWRVRYYKRMKARFGK